MRIEVLVYFLEIVRYRSFTQAAGNLFISQQGLSKAIANLERELGASLFNRSGKRIELTDAGMILLPYAEEIVARHADLTASIRKRTANQHRQTFSGMTIYAMPYICNTMFNFLELEMKECGLSECIVNEINHPADIRAEALDGPLILGNFTKDDLYDITTQMKLGFVPLFAISIIVLASKALVSPRERSVTPTRLASLPLAYYNEPTLNRIVEKLMRLEGARPKTLVMHTSNHAKILSLVHEGKAVTFSDTFSLSLRKLSKDIIALRMKPPVTLQVGFLANPDLADDSSQRAYIRQFKMMLSLGHQAYLKKNPGSFETL